VVNRISFGIFGAPSDFTKLTPSTNMSGNDLAFVDVAGLVINSSQFVVAVLFVGLVSYLFRKATSFEAGVTNAIITPEKERFYKEIK
jgi:hypothetical protein